MYNFSFYIQPQMKPIVKMSKKKKLKLIIPTNINFYYDGWLKIYLSLFEISLTFKYVIEMGRKFWLKLINFIYELLAFQFCY